MEKEHRGVFGASPLPFSSIGSVYLFWHKTKHEKTTTTKRRKREKRDTHTHTEYHRRPFFSVCLCVYKQSDFSLVHEGGRGKKRPSLFISSLGCTGYCQQHTRLTNSLSLLAGHQQLIPYSCTVCTQTAYAQEVRDTQVI